jgi:hypothetical protein
LAWPVAADREEVAQSDVVNGSESIDFDSFFAIRTQLAR